MTSAQRKRCNLEGLRRPHEEGGAAQTGAGVRKPSRTRRIQKHHANGRFALSADLHDAVRELHQQLKIVTMLSSFARTARNQCA